MSAQGSRRTGVAVQNTCKLSFNAMDSLYISRPRCASRYSISKKKSARLMRHSEMAVYSLNDSLTTIVSAYCRATYQSSGAFVFT